MGRSAIVGADGSITNIVMAGPGFTAPDGSTLVDDNGYAVGGKLINGVYTPPIVVPPTPVDLPARDADALNEALTAPGSVVRALGLLMLEEINKLRVRNGDAAYTMAQFINALKAKMR